VASFLEALKYLLNGAKTPNWVKLTVGLALVGAIYAGQRLAVGELVDAQRQTTAQQIREMRRVLIILRRDNEDTRAYIQEVAEEDSVRAKRVEKLVRRVDAKVDEINEHGTDGSNARIDALHKLIKDRRR